MNSTVRLALLASTVLPAFALAAPVQAEAAADAADAPAIIVYGVPDGYDIEKTRTATKTESTTTVASKRRRLSPARSTTRDRLSRATSNI